MRWRRSVERGLAGRVGDRALVELGQALATGQTARLAPKQFKQEGAQPPLPWETPHFDAVLTTHGSFSFWTNSLASWSQFWTNVTARHHSWRPLSYLIPPPASGASALRPLLAWGALPRFPPAVSGERLWAPALPAGAPGGVQGPSQCACQRLPWRWRANIPPVTRCPSHTFITRDCFQTGLGSPRLVQQSQTLGPRALGEREGLFRRRAGSVGSSCSTQLLSGFQAGFHRQGRFRKQKLPAKSEISTWRLRLGWAPKGWRS